MTVVVETKVTIETLSGKTIYTLRVPAEDTIDNERKTRKVLAASIEMGAALLDAEFAKESC